MCTALAMMVYAFQKNQIISSWMFLFSDHRCAFGNFSIGGFSAPISFWSHPITADFYRDGEDEFRKKAFQSILTTYFALVQSSSSGKFAKLQIGLNLGSQYIGCTPAVSRINGS